MHPEGPWMGSWRAVKKVGSTCFGLDIFVYRGLWVEGGVPLGPGLGGLGFDHRFCGRGWRNDRGLLRGGITRGEGVGELCRR